MINNQMNNDKKPNEKLGITVDSSLKIIDPDTKQVLLHKRAD